MTSSRELLWSSMRRQPSYNLANLVCSELQHSKGLAVV